MREGREGNLVLFGVDACGSMAARQRMGAVKGAVLSLLRTPTSGGTRSAWSPSAARRRAGAAADLVGRGRRRRLTALPTGGRTPLAAGLLRAPRLLRVERIRDPRRRPLLVVVTDGRATGRRRVTRSRLRGLRRRCWPARGTAVVVDCEAGPVRLGLAGALGGTWRRRRCASSELAAARWPAGAVVHRRAA